tara:strand:+ start:1230 stop:1703 length:474 start_codon:yes stop_codon:yes gene_type:complete
MAFKLNSKTLPVDVAFTSNGINYPANWLRLTTLDEKKAIGITEVADEATYDERFYWSPSKAKDLAGLKTSYIKEQKNTASSLLAPYDWYIIRQLEESKDIPASVSKYRDDVRTSCNTREKEINAVTDVTALKTLIDGIYDRDGKKTAGLTDWPEPLS